MLDLRMTRRWVLGAAASLWLAGCTSSVVAPPAPQAAVAMPDTFSADVATDVLRAGGNAVDAAVAAAFVLAVTYPEAGNLGGGGFMLARIDGEDVFVDYREVAPAAARRDMYLDAAGEVIEGSSLTGHRAVGVPGTVAGLWAAHQKFGRLPWHDVVAPAIRLAVDGYAVPAGLARSAAGETDRLRGRTNFLEYFAALQAGQHFRQPELAIVLERIAREGPDGFYHGETARLIVAEMQRGQGLITAADLANYRPAWRQPLRASWRGYDVLAAPPPSSGGFAVIQLLKMKEQLAAEFDGLPVNSAQYVHLVAEMAKRVFADRAEYFGDPDFVPVRIDELLDEEYIAARAAAVDRVSISTVASVPPGLETRHTTHFSVLDRWGNAVANTYTLNTEFGSGVVVTGAGFLLNNEMDDFSAKPGVPNFYGVVGADANAIEPGKRMLSSMSPTILLRDGTVELVLGSQGGSTIITQVFQAIVDIVDYDMTPRAALAAPRFHHQLLPPDLITHSPLGPLPEATIDDLRQRGYRVEPHPWELGDVQVVARRNGLLEAASDPRGRGTSRIID